MTRDVDGVSRKVEHLNYTTISEDWNEYRLDDGAIVKVRVVVKDISQVLDDDGSPLLSEAGDPVLQVGSATLVSVERIEDSNGG